MTTTTEYLKTAKQLLIDKGWIKGDYARDADGNRVPAVSSSATCYCILGALKAASHSVDDHTGAMAPLRCSIVNAINGMRKTNFGADYGIHPWNDDPARTKEEVLAVFDAAIATEEAMEAVHA